MLADEHITANLCGLLHYKIQMGIFHCIEHTIPHNHMLLYIYHQADMLVNLDIQLIGKMHKLGQAIEKKF